MAVVADDVARTDDRSIADADLHVVNEGEAHVAVEIVIEVNVTAEGGAERRGLNRSQADGPQDRLQQRSLSGGLARRGLVVLEDQTLRRSRAWKDASDSE